jgi:flagellin-like protein
MIRTGYAGKKGISPLVATVLIIGFTVALAMIIIAWMAFIRDVQETTETSAVTQIICANDVMFKITNVCETATDGTYKVTIQNDGTKKIESFNARFFEAADDVAQQSITFGGDGIPAFWIESDSTVASGQADTIMVEAVPTVTINNQAVTCPSNVEVFGNLGGNIIPAC